MWSNVHFLEVVVVIRPFEWGGVEDEGSPDNIRDLSFDATDSSGKKVLVDEAYVKEKLANIRDTSKDDLSRYIL